MPHLSQADSRSNLRQRTREWDWSQVCNVMPWMSAWEGDFSCSFIFHFDEIPQYLGVKLALRLQRLYLFGPCFTNIARIYDMVYS